MTAVACSTVDSQHYTALLPFSPIQTVNFNAKRSIMDALTVFCLYVEKVETRLLHYTLLNHTVYHACFMVVKTCCWALCKLVN